MKLMPCESIFHWVKGGRLANLCKDEIVSLVLSDVVNDSLDAIASGPTAPDNTVFFGL